MSQPIDQLCLQNICTCMQNIRGSEPPEKPELPHCMLMSSNMLVDFEAASMSINVKG